MEPPRHHLRCLGHPALFAPNGDLIRFRTKKHLALLAYLAVEHSRPHRRDRMAEFLWPRADMAEARHSLATALSILRPRLGTSALETTRDHVTLLGNRLTLDLDRLFAMDILGTETTGHLEVAAFLDGFDIPDAPEFALWKDRQQARLLPLIEDGLVVLFAKCRSTGDSKLIEQFADRMLALDELSEDAIRAKMEARAMAGDRLSALRIYEEWSTRIAAELHASPSTSVEQLAARLRRGGLERAVVNDIPALPQEHSRERAFIGRGREFGLLYETWECLKKGRATHSLVLGDSGVGKTTLVERLTTAAALEGAAVCRVQAYDLERTIPFATLGGLILGLLDQPGASATPAEALAELARTAPAIRRRFSSLPPSEDSQGETARVRLTESFHELLRSVAEEHPLILVVDDLHLADDASLSVLHLVLRRSSADQMISIFTAREGELSTSVQGISLRNSLARLHGQVVTLAPLDEQRTGELLTVLLHNHTAKPTGSERKSLIRASGGFPMAIELLVQDWCANGASAVALALDAMTTDFVGESGPKWAYGHILSRLAGSMDPASRSVLDLASVLGHRLNDLTMYSVIDLSLGQTMAALGQLSELRVLREGPVGLEFANELIRAHAYSMIPSSVRRALHASVADRLVRADPGLEPTSRLEIAWHTMRAGRLQDAVPHLLEGATQAMRSGAPQSAERALKSALMSLKDRDLANATFLLVEALQEQGRWRESLDAITSLEPGATLNRSQELFALQALAKGHLGSSVSSDLFELATGLKSILQTCDHIPSRLRAARTAANICAHLRDRELARELLALVEGLPGSNLHFDERSVLGLTRAMLLYQTGDLELSFNVASACLLELQGRSRLNSVALQLESGLGALRGRQGRYEEAAAHNEQALKLAQFVGNDALASGTAGNLSVAYGRLGRYEDQLKVAQEYASTCESEVAAFFELQLAYSIASAHGWLGRPADARRAVARLDSRLGPQFPSWIRQPWLLWKADALTIAGYRSDGLQAAAEAIVGFDLRLEANAFAGSFARWLAVTCSGDGNAGRAREILNDLAENLEQFDELDQLEILCANAQMRPEARRSWLQEQIAEKLEKLPSCTSSQMRALGMVWLGPSQIGKQVSSSSPPR
jgi:DNA-binding SARP family transcriptional activator/tetratricopeptide (TPR) repeat protein